MELRNLSILLLSLALIACINNNKVNAKHVSHIVHHTTQLNYIQYAANPNWCLASEDLPPRSGSKMRLRQCGEPGTLAWQTGDGSGLMKYTSHGKTFCYDIAHGNLHNGNAIILFPCHKGVNQIWDFHGGYQVTDYGEEITAGKIQSVHLHNRCVTLHWGDASFGNLVYSWDCHWGKSQLEMDSQRWNTIPGVME
eukprot:Pgem_evm1s7256